MSAREVIGECIAVKDTEKIDRKIKGILKEGKVAKFTNIFTGKSKYVKEWKQDEMGDLEAFYYPGCKTKYVCPYCIEYKISAVNMDEIDEEENPEEDSS